MISRYVWRHSFGFTLRSSNVHACYRES